MKKEKKDITNNCVTCDKFKANIASEFQIMSTKLLEQSHIDNTNNINITNGLDKVVNVLSNLIRDLKNDTSEVRKENIAINSKLDSLGNNVLLTKDHLEQIMGKLESCSTSLIELSILSKRNAGF